MNAEDYLQAEIDRLHADLWMPSFLQWWDPVIGSVVAVVLMLISLVMAIIGAERE